MVVDPADLSALSVLLDEALELEPGQREQWLRGLPVEQQHLVGALREMLTQADATEALLATLPKLGPQEAGAHAGERVGAYRLIRQIGHGGMGSVWLAERADGSFERRIALKLPRLTWMEGLAARMARERRIGALLEHPHIARMYDAGIDEQGRPYIAMEYIEGQPIDVHCHERSLSIRERLELYLQVIRAVAYAHGRLVIHRDLKPANVLVDEQGQARLLDFGIAKLVDDASSELTQEQGRVLTASYAAPEQIAGQPVGVAADVYSLGVMLYQLLTGQLPYSPNRATPGAMEEAILAGDAPLASGRVAGKTRAKELRGEIDAILGKAMKREVLQRYATADAFAEDIERFLKGETVRARPESTWYVVRKMFKRHRTWAAASVAILLATSIGASVAIVQARRANAAAQRAQVVRDFVVDVFRVNDPGLDERGELRALPAELLLQHGASLIESRFAGQPQLQAELYGVVAKIFADMGAPELAVPYATRHLELLDVIRAAPADRAQALMLLGRALEDKGQGSAGRRLAERAVDLTEGNAELHARALVLLGSILFNQGDQLQAERIFDRAEAELTGRTGPQAARAEVRGLRGLQTANSGDFATAKPILESAIAEALAADGPLSPVAIEVRGWLAENMIIRGDIVQARTQIGDLLAALRATSRPGEIKAAMRESYYAMLMFEEQQISFFEAKDIIEHDRSALTARQVVVPESIRANIEFGLGCLYVDWGDAAAAHPLISSNAKVLRASSELIHGRWYLAAYQGRMAMLEGRHGEADAFLRERLKTTELLGAAKHPNAAYDYVLIALNLGMSGQFDAAMQVLGSAPSFDVARDARGAPSSDGLLVRRGLTRIFLERGDAAGAFAMLPPIQADPDTKFPFDEYLLRGEVLCAVGRRTEGLSSLTKSLEQHAGTDYENSPDLARARAVTGLCAYSIGQREWAAKLAALSSAAFAAQPGVSRYYQLPLVQLEAQLQQSRDRRDVRIDRARRATRRDQGAAARGDAAQLESG